MSVNLPLPVADELAPVAGVTLGYARAGIRKPNRKDVLVIKLAEGAQVAGVFTQNRFCAAPVQICREHLTAGDPVQALLINTGCANAGTGEPGYRDALTSCDIVAGMLGYTREQVLPFSTGVILEPLPMDRLTAGIRDAVAMSDANWFEAAETIMTTDTQPKAASMQVVIEGQTVTLTGISKGAGMIRPNMATMLGFIACDAQVPQDLLQSITRHAADRSFNRITIDGDTSTNDSFIVIASGQGALKISSDTSPGYSALRDAITQLAQTLAQAIVRDGEGATKFITIEVQQAKNDDEAAAIAYAVGHSPLVKTAFFASDPNLGRILAAIGYAGVADLDVNQLTLYLDDVLVAERGGRAASYREQDGQRVMQQAEITVRIVLGRGDAATTVWTCDLSHDYVSINADYRS